MLRRKGVNYLYLQGGISEKKKDFWMELPIRPGWQDHTMAPEKTEYSQQTAQRKVQNLLVVMTTLGALVWVASFGNLYPSVHFPLCISVSFEHFKHFFSHIPSHTSPTHSQSSISPTYVAKQNKQKKGISFSVILISSNLSSVMYHSQNKFQLMSWQS